MTEHLLSTLGGTELFSAADWDADFKQGLAKVRNNKDLVNQYEQALDLADKVVAKAGKAEVVFVGHSLGGGLAAFAALATKRHAYTFNAAGLSAKTVENANRDLDINDLPERVSSYRILAKIVGDLFSGGDLLSVIQAGAAAKVGAIPPNTGMNYRLPVQLKSAKHWHGMGAVIAALKTIQEKQ
jgi:hypothetical protein